MDNPQTIAFRGTYRDFTELDVVHFYNPYTRRNVIIKEGKFVSGWKIDREQHDSLVRTGHLPNKDW